MKNRAFIAFSLKCPKARFFQNVPPDQLRKTHEFSTSQTCLAQVSFKGLVSN